MSNGLLSGTLKLSDTGEVDETRFNLERSIRYSSGTGDWTLVQKQRLSGVLAAGESRVVEPWPRVFYLEEKDILSLEHKLEANQCYYLKDSLLLVNMR